MTRPSPERLALARQKLSQAQARFDAMAARAKAGERKADTRRKIILGGLLLEAARNDTRYVSVLNSLMDRISRDIDRKPFEGWSLDRELAGD
ncbi:hypothetical protein [uncultured Brevundimonas sp.]|uniref:hypothetical protein n=1 Tax=uncultured Brevundimonas sp. TaxID=213418 RepID=UPI00261DCE1D|nr:hypothetical protein [uncultured Brevundimonas sp.]